MQPLAAPQAAAAATAATLAGAHAQALAALAGSGGIHACSLAFCLFSCAHCRSVSDMHRLSHRAVST